MVQSNEQDGGRLESAGARARALFGPPAGAGEGGSHENAEGAARAPGEQDELRLAHRIATESSLDSVAAAAVAREIVAQAQAALAKVWSGTPSTDLTQSEAVALESVLHIRGRPAVRVLGSRLESLERHPGSEFWQEFIANYEDSITQAAAATGAALVSSFSSGYPPWIQGSAWLVAPNRVVTNRHVLLPSTGDSFVDGNTPTRFRSDFKMTIDFTHDNRASGPALRRPVKSILYLAQLQDPVDVAVLEIESCSELTPLAVEARPAQPLKNLYVVGHPGEMAGVPEEVRAVFGNPDGRKRVSFGQRLDAAAGGGDIVHDASTIGGYSGGPIVRISSGQVGGLHYYGDPASGNLAVTADAIRAHEAFQYFTSPA